MRTTVDIPDELYRRAKAQAASRGIRLRELVEEGLRQVLGLPGPAKAGRRVQFPLIRSKRPGTLTSEEVYRSEEEAMREEDKRHGRLL